jgi:hypothetical protein
MYDSTTESIEPFASHVPTILPLLPIPENILTASTATITTANTPAPIATHFFGIFCF